MKKWQRKTIGKHRLSGSSRKMTDAQICDFIDDLQATAAEGRIKEYLQLVTLYSGNHRNGIGDKTIAKLRQIAEDEGYINGPARSD